MSIFEPVADTSDLIKEMQAQFDNVPSALVKRAIIETTRSILKHAPLERKLPITVQANVEDYDLNDMVAPYEVEAVVSLKFCDGCVPVVNECRGACLSWEYTHDGKLMIYTPQSDSDDQFVAHAVITTPSTVCIVPQLIMRRYREALSDGVISRLFSMPSMPWTDLRASGYYAGLSNAAMVEAQTMRAVRGSQQPYIQKGTRVL